MGSGKARARVRVRIILPTDDGREYRLGEAEVLEWNPVNRRALLQVDPASVRAPEGTVLPPRWWVRLPDGMWQAENSHLKCRIERLRAGEAAGCHSIGHASPRPISA